jgi:hypothetical protein
MLNINAKSNTIDISIENCTKVKGKTLGGLAVPQTPSLLNVKGKKTSKTLGFAQTQQGNNSPAPLIVKTVSKCAILN